ncbi:MAG TPA: kelch repeat-containing protein, partial [Polyangia bacterium]|nr:kelch repeat-containing protein [Polyangia bacterium]
MRRLALLVALVCAAGCSSEKKRTELILGVATDLMAPTPLTDVEMHAYRLPEGVEVGNQIFMISGTLDEDYELPGTYDVYSPTGTADRIRVVLDGHAAGNKLLVERTAVLTMVPGQTLFVRLGVVSACEGMNDCPAGDTCIAGRCQSEDIDTTLLPAYTAGMEKTVACLGATTFVDTSTKQPLPLVSTADGGAPCGQGTCAEGVCLAAAPGTFSPTKGPLAQNRVASMQIGGKLITLDDDKGHVLFVGGLAVGTSATLKSAELYDPTTQTFSATGDLTTPRAYYAAAKLRDGRVLVAGGINDAGAALASAELYDPAAKTFTATKVPLNVAR